MSTNARTLDFKAVQNIIAKRKMIRVTDDKQLVKLFVQSTIGTTIPVTTKDGEPVLQNGIPLYKTIYNVAANSHVAMVNPQNRAILTEAMKAETAGEMVKATELYNQYLNKIQVSFNMLITSPNVEKFTRNDQIQGIVTVITTENGQLITLDKVKSVTARELGDSQKFSLNELLGISDETPNPEDLFKAETGVEKDQPEITQD